MKLFKNLLIMTLVILSLASCSKKDPKDSLEKETKISENDKKDSNDSKEKFVEKKNKDEKKNKNDEEKKDLNKDKDSKDKKENPKDKKEEDEPSNKDSNSSQNTSISEKDYKLFKDIYMEMENYEDEDTAYNEISKKHNMTVEELKEFMAQNSDAASERLMEEVENDFKLKDNYAEEFKEEIKKAAINEILALEKKGDLSSENLTVQLYTNELVKDKNGETYEFNYGVFGSVTLGDSPIDVDLALGFKSLDDLKNSKAGLLTYFSSSGIVKSNIDNE
ncbi:hypothetical protein VLK81_00185 [Citroniella saccharovorans]|uniref:Uncharacterized protein n=1 Tax=Citroniella saccharovorans TaxID=2053367 RepID=A0AAW9MV72_9FIRM|nr:hypothetical protein [Citroniella saccharovorans]MEB3428475.1 hypothetical protein [Citroniella saccharovorans]